MDLGTTSTKQWQRSVVYQRNVELVLLAGALELFSSEGDLEKKHQATHAQSMNDLI